jgi:hypothetical protein
VAESERGADQGQGAAQPSAPEREVAAGVEAAANPGTGGDASPTTPDPPAASPEELGTDAGAPTSIDSLTAFYAVRGATPTAKLLAHLAAEPRPDLDDDDKLAALELLPERDPDLARTRALLRDAYQTRNGVLGPLIASFVGLVLELRLDGAVDLRRDTAAPAELLSATLEALAPQAQSKDRGQSRAATGTGLLAVAWLAEMRNLSDGDAIDALRAWLGPPAEYAQEVRNPRVLRLRQITDPKYTPESLRRWLDVLEPSLQRAAASAERADRAAHREQVLVAQNDELARELQTARAEARRLALEVARAQGESQQHSERLRGAEIVRAHETAQVRNRVANGLEDRVRSLLETATDALKLAQPRTHVAAEKLELALDALDEELRWLRSSG